MRSQFTICRAAPNKANRYDWRKFFCAGFVAIVLTLAHAAAWAGPVEGNPRKGGTLILAMATDPSTLNCGIESSQIVAMVT